MKIKKLLRKFTVNSIDDNCYYNAEDMIDFAKYVLKEKLTLTDVSKSVVCGNCDGWGYTVDENGRRKEHCKECE